MRADAQTHAVEEADRAAAGGHRVDLQHRRGEAHAGDDGVVGALERAGIVRDVGRGAAHVEAERMGEAGAARGRRHADDAAGRAGEHGVAAAEGVGVGEAAVGLHEEEARIRAAGLQALVIAGERRRTREARAKPST